MTRLDPTSRRILAAFPTRRSSGHARLRWLTTPLRAVEQLVPREGVIVDFGCGHGLFSLLLAMESPGRRVVGVDIDREKIQAGRAAVGELDLLDRVELSVVEHGWCPTDPFDAFVCNDVLYLMGHERATEVITAACDLVTPGGRVVIKEIGPTPSWKARVNDAQERLATQVLRITDGDRLEVLAPEVIEAPMRERGFAVRRDRLDRGYPHAHLAIIGERPRA